MHVSKLGQLTELAKIVALMSCYHSVQDYLPYIDLPQAILAQDATAMQFAFGLTDEQLQNAIRVVKPLFAVNTTCLAACNAAAPGRAPGGSASG